MEVDDGAIGCSVETQLVDQLEFNNKDVLSQEDSKDSTIKHLSEQTQEVDFKLRR